MHFVHPDEKIFSFQLSKLLLFVPLLRQRNRSDYKLTWSHHSSRGSKEFAWKCAFFCSKQGHGSSLAVDHTSLFPLKTDCRTYLSFRAKSHMQVYLHESINGLQSPTAPYSFFQRFICEPTQNICFDKQLGLLLMFNALSKLLDWWVVQHSQGNVAISASKA